MKTKTPAVRNPPNVPLRCCTKEIFVFVGSRSWSAAPVPLDVLGEGRLSNEDLPTDLRRLDLAASALRQRQPVAQWRISCRNPRWRRSSLRAGSLDLQPLCLCEAGMTFRDQAMPSGRQFRNSTARAA
jgi:hypothetical protein